MKRIIALSTALVLCLSLAACGAGTEATTEMTAEATEPLPPVTITIPKELAGAETQKELEERYSGDGYLEAVLNEDGSVTLTMTPEKHAELLADTEKSIRDSLVEMAAAEDNRFTKIEVNDNFSHYTVYLPAESLNLGESFYSFSFLFSSGLYYVVLGQEPGEVTIDYVNELTGHIIYTYPEPSEG